jgi:APA family basic amino acid/polyamine antiporter
LSPLQKVQAETAADNALARHLGGWDLVMLGIGGILGAGIFVSTGVVAADHTGPAIVLSFLIAAAACFCAALCYAEFAAMVPASGSAYNYAHAAFGRSIGWLIGWCLLLEYLMAAATVAVGWSAYLVNLLGNFGIIVPAAFSTAPISSVNGAIAFGAPAINAPALMIVLLLALVLVRGVKLSVRVNSILVVVKVAVIFLFIGVASLSIDVANWQPFLPPNSGTAGEYGWSGVFRGAAIIFYAYLGFDGVSTAAKEARSPQRSVPIGIMGSLLFCTGLYILFALTLTGIAPYPVLGSASPVSAALDHVGSHLAWLKVTVAIGAVIGLTSVLVVLLFGLSRILFAMGVDGLVPSLFARISERSRAPAAGIIASGLAVAATAATFPIHTLSELISMGTLVAFVFVCAGVLVLRHREPDVARPFRVPFAPVVCTTGILVCGYMLLSLPERTWLGFLIWILAGAAYLLLRLGLAARRNGATTAR